LKAEKKLSLAIVVLAVASVLAMVLVLEGTLYPIPEAPKNWLPYLFLAYLGAAVAWYGWQTRESRRPGVSVVLEPVSEIADIE
jgi:drug/metabolite transporter (DMT)-like permease